MVVVYMERESVFCEMSAEEMQIVSGGGVLDLVTNFLANQVVWRLSSISLNNYQPVYPKGTVVDPPMA